MTKVGLSEGSLLTVKEKVKYAVFSVMLCSITGWLFYRSIIASAVMCLLPLFFYKRYAGYLENVSRDRMNIEFKDVLYAFSDSAASGKQAASAVYAAYDSLRRIYGDDDRLTAEFGQMWVRIKETNEAPEKILMEFARECGVEDIRNFMEIYCICIKSGGNREKAISKAAGIISDKINLRQELGNILVQKKLEAVILCTIPPAVLMFMQMTSGGYGEVLYSSPQGRAIMTLCLAAALWAGNLCLKIMDIRI